MSTEAPVPIEARLAALERTFGFLIESLVDTLCKTHLRLLALQTVLETKGVLTDPEIAAKMQALSDAADLEVEYGDNPAAEQFRELRRIVKDKLAQQPPEGTET